MSTSATQARSTWGELSSPADYTADCRAARAHLTAPLPGPATPTGTPEHRFDEISSMAARVAYELD